MYTGCCCCRYTKALEVIKKLHKEQAQDIKMQKLKLENLQTLKDAAYKVCILIWYRRFPYFPVIFSYLAFIAC